MADANDFKKMSNDELIEIIHTFESFSEKHIKAVKELNRRKLKSERRSEMKANIAIAVSVVALIISIIDRL